MHAKPRLRYLALTALTLLLFAGCAANKPFTVVLIPDTQNYSEKYPDTYTTQTQWIRDNARESNTRFAIHLGDIVQTANQENQWQVADRAQGILEGAVPYSLAVGNHDMDHEGKKLTKKTSLYDKYFPPSRFEKYPWYGGHMGQSNLNNYCYFRGGGEKFMVLSLEFAPSDETLQWASEVVDSHPEHAVIVATHYYMRPEGRVKDDNPYGFDGAGPQELWDRFLSKHSNIIMIVSGHVLGVQHQTNPNDQGQIVHEILCDYQGEANGGDGWLQTMRFVPKEETIYVQAYSPTLKKERTGGSHTYTLPLPKSRLP